MERRFPMILLNSMDLPTLGRPTMAMIGFGIRGLPPGGARRLVFLKHINPVSL